MRVLYVFALLGTLLLTGCAGNPMTPVADQTLPAAAPDMAKWSLCAMPSPVKRLPRRCMT